jgi:hypothetical protein
MPLVLHQCATGAVAPLTRVWEFTALAGRAVAPIVPMTQRVTRTVKPILQVLTLDLPLDLSDQGLPAATDHRWTEASPPWDCVGTQRILRHSPGSYSRPVFFLVDEDTLAVSAGPPPSPKLLGAPDVFITHCHRAALPVSWSLRRSGQQWSVGHCARLTPRGSSCPPRGAGPSPLAQRAYESGPGCTTERRDPGRCAGTHTRAGTHTDDRPDCGCERRCSRIEVYAAPWGAGAHREPPKRPRR